MDSQDEAAFNVADWQGKVLLDVNGEKIGKAAELITCDQAEFERRFNEPSQASEGDLR